MPRGRKKGSTNLKTEGGSDNKEGLLIGDGKYRIISDSLNVILQEQRIVQGVRGRELTKAKAGDIQYDNKFYYSSPKSALESILKKEIMGTGFKNLQLILDRINEVEKWIQSIPDSKLPQRQINRKDIKL